MDRSDSDSFPLGGQIVGSPPSTGMTVGGFPAGPGETGDVPSAPPSPAPSTGALSWPTWRRRRRRAGGEGGTEAGRKVCPAAPAEAGTRGGDARPVPQRPQLSSGALVAMGKSRSALRAEGRCGQGSPATLSLARAASARRCRTQTRYRPLGWPPGQQALAGAWEGTWAHFLPRSFLPRRKK